ncbi:MAG: hypothetical protein CMN98_01265 [Synechococcus sp. NP17]|nr:hypothetical protein [Synechococcus sp. NP17]|tara:strand:- start:1492 stop:1932 length:441 start_codon:yes stop_codon:yes gene_type:complete
MVKFTKFPKKLLYLFQFNKKVFFILVLSTVFINNANALTLGPLIIDSAYGQLRVVNTSKRFRKVIFVAYPAKINKDNSAIIDASMDDQTEIKNLVNITPSSVRMSGNSARYVNYSIKDTGKSFFLCAESIPTSQYKIRICALWRAS